MSPPHNFPDEPWDKAEKSDEPCGGSRAECGKDSEEVILIKNIIIKLSVRITCVDFFLEFFEFIYWSHRLYIPK